MGMGATFWTHTPSHFYSISTALLQGSLSHRLILEVCWSFVGVQQIECYFCQNERGRTFCIISRDRSKPVFCRQEFAIKEHRVIILSFINFVRVLFSMCFCCLGRARQCLCVKFLINRVILARTWKFWGAS